MIKTLDTPDKEELRKLQQLKDELVRGKSGSRLKAVVTSKGRPLTYLGMPSS